MVYRLDFQCSLHLELWKTHRAPGTYDAGMMIHGKENTVAVQYLGTLFSAEDDTVLVRRTGFQLPVVAKIFGLTLDDLEVLADASGGRGLRVPHVLIDEQADVRLGA